LKKRFRICAGSEYGSKRGILATLLIKNGSIKKGMTVVVEDSLCSTRLIENFLGRKINEAAFSSPIRLVGFDKIPKVGAKFKSFQKKSDAEKYARELPLALRALPLLKEERNPKKSFR